MILFWVICAGFLLLALVFVLPPMLQRSDKEKLKSDDERKKANIAVYRDQLSELEADLQNGIVSREQYGQDRDEIERRLLEDTAVSSSVMQTSAKTARSTAYMLALGIPVVAIIFYLQIGTPDSIANPAGNRSTGSAPGGRTQEQIEANVTALAKRLQTNPSDVEGWTMLARSYVSMERFGEAAGAYAKATELNPNDAGLWADYAYATAMASGRNLDGRATELIDRALQIDPQNAKALQLAGSAAFQSKQYQKAVDYWERVLKQVPPGSEVALTITSRINEAKALAAGSSK